MHVIEIANHQKHEAKVFLLNDDDFKGITKGNFYFNWNSEKQNKVYKLVAQNEVIGLMSCIDYRNEKRIEIKLLAVSKQNRGKAKKYDRIAGTLIAFACREAKKAYGIDACVSLVPKTNLKQHYSDCYGMIDTGRQMFLAGIPLLNILNMYEL